MTNPAFGAPGCSPTWASSDKDFVTTSLGPARLWATLGRGALSEVYWPSTGEPQLRDLTFYLIGEGRWHDLQRLRSYSLSVPSPHEPLLSVTHRGEDYELTVEVLPDPRRDVLLLRYALTGPYELAVIAAPHLSGTGHDNWAWTDADGGALYAQRHRHALCLLADQPFGSPSVGYVGASDGWQDLSAHGDLTYSFGAAGPGNVALSAKLAAPAGVLALAFADSSVGAHTLARSSLAQGYPAVRRHFLGQWRGWGQRVRLPAPTPQLGTLARLSATVLRVHEDRTYPGALVASLSTPWGDTTNTLGGYHLVWPRDATLSAFALIAAGQPDDAGRVLARFIATQQPDGHWAQNTYPSGADYWTGLQLDETAFPVLLAAKLREVGFPESPGTPEMVRRAAAFIARTGPTSPQDRWEENPGANPFTLAVAISALIAAAPWLSRDGLSRDGLSGDERAEALSLATEWNERLEEWCYVQGTPLAQELGVSGYYVRLAPPQADGGLGGQVLLRNRMGEMIDASALISLDFSYLTRLGLREISDPRIQDTLRVVDARLHRQTPSGPLYYRYNDDGYGEHPDGSPFDGNGQGRLWPLLCGERGHLALEAGEDVRPYLETMRRCASPGGLLPEQVWDAPPIPERGLSPGRPTGSAMPLLWAHAEFLKLVVAGHTGRPVERLRCVEEHVAAHRESGADTWRWRNEAPVTELPAGRALRIQSPVPFTLHYGFNGWQGVSERAARPATFGLWSADLSAEELAGHTELNFTRRFGGEGETWEGRDHAVQLHHAAAPRLKARD